MQTLQEQQHAFCTRAQSGAKLLPRAVPALGCKPARPEHTSIEHCCCSLGDRPWLSALRTAFEDPSSLTTPLLFGQYDWLVHAGSRIHKTCCTRKASKEGRTWRCLGWGITYKSTVASAGSCPRVYLSSQANKREYENPLNISGEQGAIRKQEIIKQWSTAKSLYAQLWRTDCMSTALENKARPALKESKTSSKSYHIHPLCNYPIQPRPHQTF